MKLHKTTYVLRQNFTMQTNYNYYIFHFYCIFTCQVKLFVFIHALLIYMIFEYICRIRHTSTKDGLLLFLVYDMCVCYSLLFWSFFIFVYYYCFSLNAFQVIYPFKSLLNCDFLKSCAEFILLSNEGILGMKKIVYCPSL